AGSFDITSTSTRFGRALNDLLLTSIVVNEASAGHDLIGHVSDFQYYPFWQSTIGTVQSVEDVIALSAMAAVRILSNRSGAANTDLATRQKLINRMQGVMLTALTARGGTNVVSDVFIQNVLTSAHGFLPMLVGGIATAADYGIAHFGAKAA